MFRRLRMVLGVLGCFAACSRGIDCNSPPTATEAKPWLSSCCPVIYRRCNQTVPMMLASGAPPDNLDPSAVSLELPSLLSTPASPLNVLNAGDQTAFAAYASHVSAGNFDYCNSQPDSHFCLLGVTSFGGPYFAQCLPKACSQASHSLLVRGIQWLTAGVDQRDYQLLALNCSLDRVHRTINTISSTLYQLQNDSDAIDRNINNLNVTGPTKSQIEKLTRSIEELATGALAGIFGLNISKDDLKQLIDGLHDGSLAAAADKIGKMADTVTYFGDTYLAANSGFCSDDKYPEVDVSAGLLIGFTAALGLVCVLATFYEIFVLPHRVNKERGFIELHPQFQHEQEEGAKGYMASEMRWLQTIQPEHVSWVKDTSYKIPKVVQMFSMYSHTMNLLEKRTPGDFKCLNGMRTLSTGYIVLGHMYMVIGLMGHTVNRVPGVSNFATSFAGVIITGSFLSVDTFYFLSGFLGGYIMIRTIEKMKGWLDLLKAYPILIAHRYMRLTPVYAYVLWWYVSGSPLLLTGPNYYDSAVVQRGNAAYSTPDKFCTTEGHWVENLVYVNSWIPLDKNGIDTCMGWSWYLANDMLYFCIMPLVLFLWAKHRYIGLTVLSSIIVEHVLCVVALSEKYELGPFNTGDPHNAKYLYSRPWTRCAPYFIGVCLGLYFHHKKEALKARSINTVAQPLTGLHFVTYVTSGVLMVMVAFILPWLCIKDTTTGLMGRGSWSQGGNTAFNALQRPL